MTVYCEPGRHGPTNRSWLQGLRSTVTLENMSLLGFTGQDRKRLVSAVWKQAETALQWLWRKRNERWKKPQ